jgi:prepilin-type N-terminal cleavage/methylation domain-containing protein
MMKRSGFTLIELLIVIVIIGILAAIAMPKLGKTRERGYFKAMNSDLRNLATQQEIYFSDPQNQTYAGNTAAMANFVTSPGVTATITAAGVTGWGAVALHTGLSASQSCAVFYGTVGTLPGPATTAGVVTCTGE